MTRITTLAAAVALALLAAGCGTKCNDETPPVAAVPVDGSCQAVAGTAITVPIRVCPECDQGSPSCLVHLDNVSRGSLSLEPVAEVCDPGSCPAVNPSSCAFAPLSCSFTAPATPGSYQVVVATPSGTRTTNLTVLAAGGSPTSCTF